MATERVVCAVDDSTSGLPVVTTAGWLAKALGAELTVVHAVSDADEDAQSLPAAVRSWLPEDEPEIRLLEGDAAPAILQAAAEQEATLLVVGSRGRGTLRTALLGSVSRDVAAEAVCPVVVVPANAREIPQGAPADGREAVVVCGTDNSDISMAAAAFSGRLARSLGSQVVMVHARQNVRSVLEYRHPSSDTPPVTGQDDSVDKLVEDTIKRAAELAGPGTTEIVEPGPPVTVLNAVADRYDAELIVVAAGGRSGLSSALLGSVAAELPVSAERPVVVIPRSVAERWGPGAEPLS